MERRPASETVLDGRDRCVGLAETRHDTGTEHVRGDDGGTSVNFDDAAFPCLAQTDGVEVDVLTAKGCHGVQRFTHAPRPSANGAKRPVSKQRSHSKTDARSHDHSVGRTVRGGEEAVVEDDPLGKRVVALSGGVKVQDAHTVFGHCIQHTVVFFEGSNIVMHHSERFLGCIVHQRKGAKPGFVANERGFESRVDRVSVIVVNEVFFEGGQRLTDLEGGQRP